MNGKAADWDNLHAAPLVQSRKLHIQACVTMACRFSTCAPATFFTLVQLLLPPPHTQTHRACVFLDHFLVEEQDSQSSNITQGI